MNPRETWCKSEEVTASLKSHGFYVPNTLLVFAACACARTALKHVSAGDDRPLRAIEAAEAWTRGESVSADVLAAMDSAETAYAAARYDYPNYASAEAILAASHAAQAALAKTTTRVDQASHYAARASAHFSTSYPNVPSWPARYTYARAEHMLLIRATIAWPVVAHGILLKGKGLGESWLETVCRWQGIADEARRDVSQSWEHEVEKLSREMAAKGRWEPSVLEPFWAEVQS